MLDFTKEDLISLKFAAELLGRHVATLYRWANDGLRGVVLESIQGGGTRYTSREALQRFFERLTSTRGVRKPSTVSSCIGSQRAAEELERRGI